MISFFVGVPGSGKTYYAVDKIYNNFSNEQEVKKDKHKYDVCYTNINEFEFEKVHIAFNTGMRVGEILGLQLVDFKDDGYIHIKRTRTKGMLGSGKTNNAIRKVPYAPFILEEAKKIQSKDNIFLFGDIDDASLLRTQWRDVCLEANVPKYKLYATRHTFATLMLKENIVSINELAGLLGHSSPKVTLEYYASVIQSKNIDLGKDFSLFGHAAVTTKNKKSI